MFCLVDRFFNYRGVLQSNPTLHSEDVFFKLVALDAIGLCANLTVMVTDDTIYKQILNCRGSGAQALLNLLQAVCSWAICPLCSFDPKFY